MKKLGQNAFGKMYRKLQCVEIPFRITTNVIQVNVPGYYGPRGNPFYGYASGEHMLIAAIGPRPTLSTLTDHIRTFG